MKILLFGIFIAICSCHHTKNVSEEPVPVGIKVTADSLSVCVKVLIEKFKSEPISNPPRKIYSYKYEGKTVYYVPAICCDQFSDVYNDSCRIMGHPDGGFTGRGDGKLIGFDTARSAEKLLWEDDRKAP